MAFFPQDDNTQDISGIPANDELAKLELQRKLKMAQALQESKNPEGQMVSGHYVAPSWTQYAANALNKYYGGKREEEAIKGYGAYTKSKEQKQADALRGFVEGMQPKATTTMQDNFVTKPLEQGMNVPTSPFGTTDQVAQIAPKFGMNQPAPQNMTGEMTTNQPTQTTTYTPRTQQELISNFYNYAQKSGNPDMANKFALEQFGQAIKPKVTKYMDMGDKQIELDENNKPTGFSLPKGIAPGSDIANQLHLAQFQETIKQHGIENQLAQNRMNVDRNKAPAGYAWGKPDASGNPTLVPLTGGPADKSQILKPVPAQVATGFVENQNAINKIDNAINVITSTPDSSFGLRNVTGDTVMQRLDPKGVSARAAISGIAGQKYHDISGAAVSVGEAKRLTPYIPSATDTKENILQKLYNMKAEYSNTNELMQNQFSEQQGYKPLQQQNIPINSSMQSGQGGWKIEKVQ